MAFVGHGGFSQLKVNGPDEEHCAFCGSSIHVPIVA